MRRIVIVVLWLLLSGAVAFMSLSKYETTERLETHIAGNITSDHIAQIWFSPAGELIGVGQDESKLIVRVWSGADGKLLRDRAIELQTAKSEAKPIFAVSSDASKAVWVGPAGVRMRNLITPTPDETS